MRGWVRFLIDLARPQARLAVENLCLRQQLAALARQQKRPRLKDSDRRFWVLMKRWFTGWRECLVLVEPETVLRWHERGWRYYWRWKSRRRGVGRKRISRELRQLIRRMADENPLWGQGRIMAEMMKLGHLVSPRTVRKYMRKLWNGTPSPRWRDFLKQYAKNLWACDFLTVRTMTFQTLYVFFLIRHDTREIVQARVTRHPTAVWTGRQLVNACWSREPPRYLIRDRDSIFGGDFSRQAKHLGVCEVRTPVRAPKANALAERFVGTLRRECLDHMFVFNERHLQKLVDEFVEYYNRHRPHRSLNQHPPCPVVPIPTGPPDGRVVATPVLGGLHHVYSRAA